MDGFADDLAASLRAWRQAPWLPALGWLLGTGPFALQKLEIGAPEAAGPVSGAETGVSLLLALLIIPSLGWPGAERVVYRRIFEGENAGEGIVRLLAAHVGRFLRLATLVLLVVIPLSLLVENRLGDGWMRILSLVVAMAFWTSLTFVPAELTFRTRSVNAAYSDGLALLREHWAEVRWHALLPALTLAILSEAAVVVAERSSTAGVLISLGVPIGLIASAAKGAVLRRWLMIRENEPASEPPVA